MDDLGPLLVGQFYRVIDYFTDERRWIHGPGDAWQFLGQVREGARVRWNVRALDGRAVEIVLSTERPWAAEVLHAPGHFVERVVELPWDLRVGCRCDELGLRDRLGAPELFVLACDTCRVMFAGEPSATGVRAVALDEPTRALLWRVLEGTWVSRLDAALTAPEALRPMAGRLLLYDPELDAALVEMLASPSAADRRRALDFLSRVDPVPAGAAAALPGALAPPLDPTPDSDDTLLWLAAAFAAAPQLTDHSAAVAAVAAGLTNDLHRRLAVAVLERIKPPSPPQS